MIMDYTHEIEKQLNEKLSEKIVRHRDRFKHLFKARYLELLPSLIKYKNDHTISVDFMKAEIAMRNGYDVVIGETLNRKIQVIGYATTKKTSGNPADLWSPRGLRHGDIHFLIHPRLQMPYYREITHDDGCKNGNFIVLRNKLVNYTNDYNILEHYVDELAEIVLSRYSISMQVKITTLFLGDANDETLNQLITQIYNGNPAVTLSELFDPDDQIYHMKNEGIAQNFQELKREYQNKISELNNMLGINSLAVEKSSGVSDAEAKSNRAYTTSNANIYLDARNDALKKLNKRYNLQIEASYNDEVISEFADLERQEIEEGEKNDNNDTL